MDTGSVAGFLRALPRLLSAAPAARRSGQGKRPRREPARRITPGSLSERSARRLMTRLDCDREGNSRRSGRPAWPQSWPAVVDLCRQHGADWWMVLVLASWLEVLQPTSRRTYLDAAALFLRDLKIYNTRDLVRLPEQAALTWQRDRARKVLPRSVNIGTAALNSLMRHATRLGVGHSPTWLPVPAVKVTRGRWIDRDPVVLTSAQLLAYWQAASSRPDRQFLAIMLASLHGLRASETARMRWGDIRQQRRGKKAAPAVIHVLGKGQRHRVVQVHSSLRGWMERQRRGCDADAFILGDQDGAAPSAKTVGRWAKQVFLRAGCKGYAHALRATWTTLALEHSRNNALQVQMSGGWKQQATMLTHYFKRRNINPIRLVEGHDRY